MWSGFAAAGAILYLIAFGCASAYAFFDHHTFSGVFAVMLALPWIDYFPSHLLLAAVALNALIIYLRLTALSQLPALFRR